ncbi:MAG: GNAT family N-acetyltransferase [Micromonosporaceae bacterium]
MAQLLTRPYEPADAPAVVDLMNLIQEHAGAHPGFTLAEMESLISGVVRDVAADTRVVVGPHGLVAAGVVATPPEGGYRVDLLGGVHPDWRGRGIGRQLLGWQLDRAARIHAAVAPGAAWEAHTGTTLGDESAIRLFERLGMTAARYWFEMTAPTTGAPALELPDGLAARRYSPDHEKALYAAHIEAFADHWGYQRRELDEWTGLTVRSDLFLPELSLLAVDGDEVVGYVLSYRDADPDRVYIGHVGVRRPWRRRGVAGALLASVLTAAGRAGYTSAGLDVDADSPTGAVGVYERVGFGIRSRSVTYVAPLPPAPATH